MATDSVDEDFESFIVKTFKTPKGNMPLKKIKKMRELRVPKHDHDIHKERLMTFYKGIK